MTRRFDTYVTVVCFSLLFMVIAGYAIFQSRNFIRGPVLSIESPVSGEVVTNRVIDLTGTALNSVSVRLNDNPVTVDERGRFDERLLLADGYNIIKIEARDRFQHVTEQVIQLVYRQP